MKRGNDRFTLRSYRAQQACVVVVAVMALLGWPRKVEARSPSLGTLIVHVVDARTGRPIFQASLTLQFRKPGSPWKLKRGKMISYSAKTDEKGFCKFPYVNEGTVELMVTAPEHEAFGRTYQFTKNDQVVEVKLRKPHSQL